MAVTKRILWVLVLALVLCGCAAEPEEANTTAPETTPEITTTAPETTPVDGGPMDAPDFTVYDSQGNPVKLSDFRGKPVVLNFWASWCGPCKREMPDFQEKYALLGQDIHFLMVNLTDGSYETVQIAQDFIARQGYSFPVYFDTSSQAANAYYIQSIPTTFFIDAEGKLIAQAVGAIDAGDLQRGIDMILP